MHVILPNLKNEGNEIENLLNNTKEDTQILHWNYGKGICSDLRVLYWMFKTFFVIPINFQCEFSKSISIVAIQERQIPVLKNIMIQCGLLSSIRNASYLVWLVYCFLIFYEDMLLTLHNITKSSGRIIFNLSLFFLLNPVKYSTGVYHVRWYYYLIGKKKFTLEWIVSNVNDLAVKAPLILITQVNHSVLCFILSLWGKHDL